MLIDIVCTNWTTQYEDAAKAFNSGVTEFAFFMMPEGISEADKTKVVEDSPPTMEAVQTIGKATGAALGWGQTSEFLLLSDCFRLLISFRITAR